MGLDTGLKRSAFLDNRHFFEVHMCGADGKKKYNLKYSKEELRLQNKHMSSVSCKVVQFLRSPIFDPPLPLQE